MKYYVVVDLEMCSVPPKKTYRYKHEIIQIGAALMNENLEIVDKYSGFVKPEIGALDDFISKLTGITSKDLKDAPHVEQAVKAFMAWLPEGEVVAISWSITDKKQLQNELEQKNIPIDERLERILDTWVDCQPMFTDKIENASRKRYSLEEALVAADIITEGRAHDGLNDAYNTALLYAKMQREDELVLNSYYESAHDDSESESLSFGLGDLLDSALLKD